MSLVFIALSAFFTALGNFFIRRAVTPDQEGDPFIRARFFTAGLVSIPIIYLQHSSLNFDPKMAVVALFAGIFLGLLQFSIGKSLQSGPSGLTFIFVSSVSVWPPLLMYFFFGAEFGHDYTLNNLVGSLLVLAALVWMGQGEEKANKKWLGWIAVAYASTTLYFLIFQWRALLLKESLPESPLLPFHVNAEEGDLFMAITFIVAALSQTFIRQKTTSTAPGFYTSGITAGLLAGISTYLLLLGTEYASSATENALIFPLQTVLLIIFCNAWAVKYYKEKVNWPANALAAAGIAIAT